MSQKFRGGWRDYNLIIIRWQQNRVLIHEFRDVSLFKALSYNLARERNGIDGHENYNFSNDYRLLYDSFSMV